MVELTQMGKNTMHQSFAGDVYNSAVYLKRCFTDVGVGVVTVLGTDPLSQSMKIQFEDELLATDLVFTSEDKVPGLYLVQTDSEGERSFTYWRDNSAARTVMNFFDRQCTEKLLESDMFFFSGISLAVIEPEARELFWQRIKVLRNAGVKIIFDPNYRAALWKSKEEAQHEFNHAFSQSDILLPGLEDFSSLYNLTDFEQVYSFLQAFNITEIVMKNGAKSVFTVVNEIVKEHMITAVENVVDTTSAGDSFNGIYLGARLNNYSLERAIELAAAAAGYVIQHKGAIVEKEGFKVFIQKV